MRQRRWKILRVVAAALALGLTTGGATFTTAAGASTEPCTVEIARIGLGSVLGGGEAYWFNVLGFRFGAEPATVAFDSPVLVWDREELGPVTSYTIEAPYYNPNSWWKYTFFAPDPSVTRIKITVSSDACGSVGAVLSTLPDSSVASQPNPTGSDDMGVAVTVLVTATFAISFAFFGFRPAPFRRKPD